MHPMGIEVIGHRGCAARFPENTVPSLIGALDAGAPSIEFDVRFTSCGTPVLFHDEDLGRTTNGEGLLADKTVAELRLLDAGGWFGPGFRGTAVPTLEEAIRAVLRRPASDGPPARRLYLELKAITRAEDLDTLLHILYREQVLDRTAVISFDFDLLRELRSRAPRLLLGYVVDGEEGLAEALPEVRRDRRTLLDPIHTMLRSDPHRTAAWIEEGIRLVTWTVNDEGDARELLALGVRRLTTDDPALLLGRVVLPHLAG